MEGRNAVRCEAKDTKTEAAREAAQRTPMHSMFGRSFGETPAETWKFGEAIPRFGV